MACGCARTVLDRSNAGRRRGGGWRPDRPAGLPRLIGVLRSIRARVFRRRAFPLAVGVGGTVVVLPERAAAHGLAGRADLPVPAEVFAAAAAGVLVVSFLALAAGWSAPRLERPRSRALFRLPRAIDHLLGAIGVAAYVALVFAGLFGEQVQTDNLAPTMVYVVFWVGIPFASLLFGDIFRLLSPWRAIGRAAGWTADRVAPGRLSAPSPYPARLGRWPAAAGLLAFASVELAWAAGQEPDTLAVLALLYMGIQLVGMSFYGVEAWTRNADAFGVWFSLIAGLSALERRDGVVRVRAPGAGAAAAPAHAGTVALLCVAIGSTAFDSIAEGETFGDLAISLQRTLVELGASLALGLELAFLLGLVVTVLAVGLVYAIAIGAMPLPRPGAARSDIAHRMAHTLVPIAAAYLVAHYFSLLVYNGQDLWRLASDPLGRGADLLGTATATIDYGVVSATAIWYVQVGALVVGHVAALVLGHDRALTLYRSSSGATRSQVVMLVLMVCFTVLGLWLLSEAGDA